MQPDLETAAARAVLENAELRADNNQLRAELEHVAHNVLLLTALAAILFVLALVGWIV